MNTKIHLVSMIVDIYEDDFENGTGKHTGCGYSESIGETFDSMEQVGAYLKRNFNIEDFGVDEDEKRIWSSKTVADHSDAQNGGWFEATQSELERWHKGELMLYSEDYYFNYLEVAT